MNDLNLVEKGLRSKGIAGTLIDDNPNTHKE